MQFKTTELPLPGLKLVERQNIGDFRGFFARIFCSDDLVSAGWDSSVAQVNLSQTGKLGTVRGLHFQYPPHAELKLVSCIKGEVWDVAIDLRANSKTFLKWHAERLSSDNQRALLIPRGFAHGFQTLKDNVELLYIHSAAYSPVAESGLNPIDPILSVPWPAPITNISPRDKGRPFLNNTFRGLHV